jgi:TRAP-type mannitol/chloroaromatic compound transport system permease small subunit
MLRFADVVDFVNQWAGKLLGYLIFFMLITGVYEVGMRYFFNSPTTWVWELNGLLLCVFVALTGGHGLLHQSHVRVDILYERLSMRLRAIVDLFSSFFMFLFLSVLCWQTTKMSLQSVADLEHTQSIFSPPIYPFKVMLALGIFLFLLQGLAQFARNLFTAITGRER